VVCDLVAGLLRHMDDKHATTVTPSLRSADAEMERRPFCDPENFSSGYIMRSRTSCSSRAAGSPGRTCWSTTRNGRPCQTPTLMDPRLQLNPRRTPNR